MRCCVKGCGKRTRAKPVQGVFPFCRAHRKGLKSVTVTYDLTVGGRR